MRAVPGRVDENGRYTPTYVSWKGMKQRCFYPRDKCFDIYGGRGITICDRWLVFSNFLEDMGVRPEGTTLDRIDSNGNYEPGNVRWATPTEQTANLSRPVGLYISSKGATCQERE